MKLKTLLEQWKVKVPEKKEVYDSDTSEKWSNFGYNESNRVPLVRQAPPPNMNQQHV